MSYCEYCSNSLADTESVSKKIVLRILFQESNFAIQKDIFEFSTKRNYKISCIILPTIAKKEISLGVQDDADQNIFFHYRLNMPETSLFNSGQNQQHLLHQNLPNEAA